MCYVTNPAAGATGRNGSNGYAVERNRAMVFLRRTLAKLFILTGISATLFGGHDLYEARETERTLKTAVREQILASSIQIKMVAKGRIIAGVKKMRVAKGLGTVVECDGQRFVMTHNHWEVAEDDLERVELRDANGQLLTTMARMSYLSLVRYQDAGTLLLAAPPELDGIKAAHLGSSTALIVGESLWIVTQNRQQDGCLTVVEARVDQAGGKNMPAQLLLHGPETAVVPGDSGGGVWQNGILVGNMWAIVESLQETPWGWQGWFSSPMKPEPTGGYIVAEQPRAGKQAAGQLAKEGVVGRVDISSGRRCVSYP